MIASGSGTHIDTAAAIIICHCVLTCFILNRGGHGFIMMSQSKSCQPQTKGGINMAAGIKKRKDGRLELRFTVNGKRYSVFGHTQKEIRTKENELRQRIAADEFSPRSAITLKRYYELFDENRADTVKESTRYVETHNFLPVLNLIGNLHVRDIDRNVIFSLQEELKKTHSIKAVNSKITILSCVLKNAVYDGILKENPCDSVRKLREPKSKKSPEARDTIHRALTKDETTRFFDAAADSWYLELFQFLISTGVRIGEACALQWSDIDRTNRYIHISKTISLDINGGCIVTDPKTKTSMRSIPLTVEVETILKRQRKKCLDTFGKIAPLYVFANLNGKRVDKKIINNTLTRLCRDTGIERFTCHAFRDTFATRCIESGMNPRTLQELAGHADYGITMNLYGHVTDDTKESELKSVEFGV